MIDRRGILKLLPAAAIPLAAERIVGKELATKVEAKALPVDNRYLLIFQPDCPLRDEFVERLNKQARSALDHLGFGDVKAIVLPHGMKFHFFSLPGGAPCLASEPSNSASSAPSP